MPGEVLRIAGVDPELGFGGGETQVLGLTRELLAMGHHAELICNPAGRLWEGALAIGVRCRPLGIRNAIDLRAALRLRAILNRERYAVVHFHTSRAHAMAPFVRGCAPVSVVTRRMDYRPNRVFAPYYYNRAVDGVAAISSGVADALVSAGVTRERITIIPSGVDVEHFRPPTPDERAASRAALGLGAQEIAIGNVAMLEPRKGHHTLLEAIARFAHGTHPEFVCWIGGDGSQREQLRAEAERLGIAKLVRFVGRIDDPRSLLWALDIFAMPSLKEGLGVALLEASACGLAAVASEVGGIRDVGTGLLVPPRDSEALATALRQLLESSEVRARLGERARQRMMSEFSMGGMAERTLAFYKATLAPKAGGDQAAK